MTHASTLSFIIIIHGFEKNVKIEDTFEKCIHDTNFNISFTEWSGGDRLACQFQKLRGQKNADINLFRRKNKRKHFWPTMYFNLDKLTLRLSNCHYDSVYKLWMWIIAKTVKANACKCFFFLISVELQAYVGTHSFNYAFAQLQLHWYWISSF